MYRKILEQDWSEYDNRKITDRKDKDIFCCTQKWETDFLVIKIKNAYPLIPENMIKRAISDCCKQENFKENHFKIEFISRVMESLSFTI